MNARPHWTVLVVLAAAGGAAFAAAGWHCLPLTLVSTLGLVANARAASFARRVAAYRTA